MLLKITQLNLFNVVKPKADYQLAFKITQKHKDGYKTKFNCLRDYLMSRLFIFAFFTRDISCIKKVLRQVLLSAFKNIVPIRKNRHCQRYGRFMKSMSNYRFSLDGRNKPVEKAQ